MTKSLAIMIKKLSLYGLCFNLSVAFGYPTQATLEKFLAAQGDKIKVVREAIGKCNFPIKVILKDEDAKKAWKGFSKQHGGYFQYEISSEKQVETSEVTSKENKEVGSLSTEAQSLEVASEVNQAGRAESIENSAEASEDVADSEEYYYPNFKKRTEEEMRACFLKYSREATEAELASVAGWGVKGLRFVDFDSIVSGLDDETQKEEARRLIKEENEVLSEAIDKWVEEREVRSTYSLKIFISGEEEPVDGLPYKLNPEVIKAFKESLKITLKGMARCKSSRETLVLSLVLLKDLKLEISTWGAYYRDRENVIEFQFFKHEPENVQSLCHELNHVLHYHLGIEAHYSLVGNLESVLEGDLFRLDGSAADADSIRITSELFSYLFQENWNPDMPAVIEVPRKKFFKTLQIALLWNNFEETWNIIGFANIDDCIYVNTLSDLNYMKVPALFHSGFLQSDWKNLGACLPTYDLSPYPSVKLFLEKMEEVVTKNIADLCPTPEAWKAWLKLQGREAGVRYFTTVDKTLNELMTLSKTVELIEDK